MTRTPTTTDTTVEWQERVTDPDSDSLTISLELDAVDDGSGFTDDGTDSSNLSWLSFTKTASTLEDGTLENLVNIVSDKSGLNQGYTYRFKITADDGTTAVPRTFTLSIEEPPTYSGDGIFTMEDGTNTVYKYSFAKRYDISSVTQVQSQALATNVPDSRGVFIAPDGKTLVFGDDDNGLYQYNMSTAEDLTTISYVRQNDISATLRRCNAFSFVKSENKLYICNGYNGEIAEYNWGTLYDISTLSLVQTVSVDNTLSIAVKEDGTKAYRGKASFGNTIREYDLTTPYDISSATSDYFLDLDNQGFPTQASNLHIQENGEAIFYNTGDEVVKIPLSTPFDLSTFGTPTTNTTVSEDGSHIAP